MSRKPDNDDLGFAKAIEEAMAETDAALAADPTRSIADPTLPIYRLNAAYELAKEEKRFAAGDRNALLGAIRICANHDLVMPEWLARAFIRSYDKVLRHDVGSWDDAFGRPLPKGKHLNAARKKRNKGFSAWIRVRQLHDQGRAIDEQLFEDVGKELGLGKTLVSEYYYDRGGGLPEKRKILRKDSKPSRP